MPTETRIPKKAKRIKICKLLRCLAFDLSDLRLVTLAAQAMHESPTLFVGDV
jgi:hypothetical protein